MKPFCCRGPASFVVTNTRSTDSDETPLLPRLAAAPEFGGAVPRLGSPAAAGAAEAASEALLCSWQEEKEPVGGAGAGRRRSRCRQEKQQPSPTPPLRRLLLPAFPGAQRRRPGAAGLRQALRCNKEPGVLKCKSKM